MGFQNGFFSQIPALRGKCCVDAEHRREAGVVFACDTGVGCCGEAADRCRS
jgi:hypothetical protein